MSYAYNVRELPKKYDHKETEKRWQQHWVEQKTYCWRDDAPRDETFVIDTPPPTVSGLLHMGHVFSYTQCDFVARYQRMKGKDVFYPMGFDDNGLPTERLVEKVHKKRATDYETREDFIKVCDEVAEDARKDFRALFQSVALSVDWDNEYHTISDECRTIGQLSFLDLMEKGHVERRLQPFFWDPVDQTAIAQAEIEDKELPSHFSDITFGIEGSDETIIIATTRPELIPACVGIFYHPDDERYQHLKGKHAITPLFGVKVPVLEDDTVEIDKGTGIMMCCTFGDEADIEKWKKHDLPARVVLNKYAKIDFGPADWLNDCPAKQAMQNKKVSNPDKNHPGARQIILQLLEESGDLLKSDAIVHTVKCAERSGAPLEILPTQQWFVKLMDKKEQLHARINECDWFPDWMKLRAEQWNEGLNSDWCISRQRYFGVPFPVWHGLIYPDDSQKPVSTHMGINCTIVAKQEDLPVNPLIDIPSGFKEVSRTKLDNGRLQIEVIATENIELGSVLWKAGRSGCLWPDADVMDTWATSSVSPQLNSHWKLNPERHAKLFPADLRPQAHEIIRTWAYYTIVKAHLHEDTIPWKNLMISGWCLAEDKTKMSKSKGNVVTPVELIEQQGTDAVRYWAATSRLGQDTAYSTDLLKIGKKLVTKLWNATKFAAIHLEKLDGQPTTAVADVKAGKITEALDLWILTRLQRAVKKSTEAYEKYEYADALRATEDFFWNDFCDNYLELVKKRVYDEAGDDAGAQQSAVVAIYHCLQGILKLFAPVVPHITEELYAHLFVDNYEAHSSLHARGQWPSTEEYPIDEQAEQSGIAAMAVLEAIRKAKSEKNVSIKYPITQMLIHSEQNLSWKALEPASEDLKSAGNVENLVWNDEKVPGSTLSEDESFSYHITFAPEAEVA